MYKKSLLFLALLGSIMLSQSSCKKFLDTNLNPNVVQESQLQPALLLPTAQLGLGSAMGVDVQINGSIWAQYWTQYYLASQYRVFEQYQPDASQYDRVWGLFYNQTLKDLHTLDRIAASQNADQYRAIAKLLSAYTFQVITDAWGDVPFSQALRGAPDEGGIISPAYDRQQDIYNGLIQMVDEGMALIDLDDENHPGDDDLIYHGDMELWQKFGNTLKLKIYMRLSEVNPGLAQQGIQALYASNPDFIAFGEDAMISYSSTSGNQNPLYSEIVGLGNVQNLVASATSVDSLTSNDDERRFSFYIPSGGTVFGLKQGFYDAPPTTQVSPPSPLVGAWAQLTGANNSAEAPVKFISSYESLFLQAEAAARGWGTGNAEALFEQGIINNFRSYELTTTDANDYIANSYWGSYPSGGSLQQQIRHIITQKWFSMNGNQGFEAWTEWRRTGYPDFLVESANTRLGQGRMPNRFFYPNTEVTRNLNFPGQPQIFNKVWWDVN